MAVFQHNLVNDSPLLVQSFPPSSVGPKSSPGQSLRPRYLPESVSPSHGPAQPSFPVPPPTRHLLQEALPDPLHIETSHLSFFPCFFSSHDYRVSRVYSLSPPLESVSSPRCPQHLAWRQAHGRRSMSARVRGAQSPHGGVRGKTGVKRAQGLLGPVGRGLLTSPAPSQLPSRGSPRPAAPRSPPAAAAPGPCIPRRACPPVGTVSA